MGKCESCSALSQENARLRATIEELREELRVATSFHERKTLPEMLPSSEVDGDDGPTDVVVVGR